MSRRAAWIARICVTIVLGQAFFGCASSIKREGYIVTPSDKEIDCRIVVKKQEDFHAKKGTVLGTMKVGDTGFSVKCSEADVLKILRSEGCKLGAQVIVLRDIIEPSFFGSSCYRVTADFVALSDTTEMPDIQPASLDSRDTLLAFRADTERKLAAAPKPQAKYDMAEWTAQYQYFTDNSMNEAYAHGYGLYFNGLVYGRQKARRSDPDTLIATQGMFRFEGGFLFASGQPLQRDTDWKVVKSDLGMILTAIGGTGIYEFDKTGEKTFVPYVGVGLGFFLGFERISAHVYKDFVLGESHYEWHDTCYRHSFAGHAVLGATLRKSGRFSYVGEIRWTQGGKGRLKRLTLSAEELAQGWGEAFQDFQQPDFNFTGASINIGVRW